MDRKILIVAAVAVIAILCASFLAMDQLSKPGDDDDDLVIENAGTYTDGTYDDVTIAPSVGDGTVILSGMTIEGDLLINGGGSQSIILQNSSVEGTTKINKSNGEIPRLLSDNSTTGRIVVESDAILESRNGSSYGDVEVTGSRLTVQGIDTIIRNVELKGEVGLDFTGGRIDSVKVDETVNITTNTQDSVESLPFQTTDPEGPGEVNVNDKPVEVEKVTETPSPDHGHTFTYNTTWPDVPGGDVTITGVCSCGSSTTSKHTPVEVSRTPSCESDGSVTYNVSYGETKWAHLDIPEIDFQDIIYYAAPKQKPKLNSMDEVDPELKRTFDKLGIPLEEQMALAGVAVDAVMDSVSVKTTFRDTLAEKGIIFCSISEAIKEYPELIKKYLGSVVPYTDNFYAALNAAVFSDGSFCYIPKGVRCPMELSTYFRINAEGTGQFERTLIVADEGAYVSYLEGCTAPRRDENQLHAAVVEIVVEKDADVKYSTVQNWYPGDKEGKGGIYNFVTKRGICREGGHLSWTQVETGSAITWKYPSCVLQGDNSSGEFYSVAMTNNYQQADTGTKMIHIGKNTRSRIVSKGISAGRSQNAYRGLVRVAKGADNARNYSQCDSLLIGDKCGAHTFPVVDCFNPTAVLEHEATTSKISEDQLFYCNQRGLSTEDAVGLIVNGYAREVLAKLPMEFAVEAQKLLSLSLEGSVG